MARNPSVKSWLWSPLRTNESNHSTPLWPKSPLFVSAFLCGRQIYRTERNRIDALQLGPGLQVCGGKTAYLATLQFWDRREPLIVNTGDLTIKTAPVAAAVNEALLPEKVYLRFRCASEQRRRSLPFLLRGGIQRCPVNLDVLQLVHPSTGKCGGVFRCLPLCSA